MTIAAWLVMAGSVFVVLTAFVDQIAALHSLETRESVEEFLSRASPARTSAWGSRTCSSVMRVLTMFTAACATVAGILGYQLLRRSRSEARFVLTSRGTAVLTASGVGSSAFRWSPPRP